MNPEIIFYAIGGICTFAAAVFGAVKVGRTAGSVATSDPNEQLLAIVADVQARLTKAEESGVIANARVTVLESSLRREQGLGVERDHQIAALQDENNDQRQQLSILRRALEGWEAWHRLLISKWDEYRAKDTAPAPPDITNT